MIVPENEFQALLALSLNDRLSAAGKLQLLCLTGNALDLFQEPDLLYDSVLSCPVEELKDKLFSETVARKVVKCLSFIEKNPQVHPIPFGSRYYPRLLSECHDAPVMLFYIGNLETLGACHLLSMVGTRKCTQYGKDICGYFCSDLHKLMPDATIVSGLAYGIDGISHSAAIDNNLRTIGVLAHGLDDIYPAEHRNLAERMVEQGGGLLSEFGPQTTPFKQNFIARNRIIAGMTHATIVVESGFKGGSLITAELANDYGRECFAFPQNIFCSQSAGCNMLIGKNMAHLITSASDFVDIMGWGVPKQLDMFAVGFERTVSSLDENRKKVFELIRKSHNGASLEEILPQCCLPIPDLTVMLLDLELKGLIQTASGGRYFVKRF